MVREFSVSENFNAPNLHQKNNKVMLREFRKGEPFVGQILNLGKAAGVNGEMYVNRENWIIPRNKLTPKSKEKFDSFSAYEKEKNTLNSDELPPEIQKKVEEIAKKNFALTEIKSMQSTFRSAVTGAVIGSGIAFFTHKNVYAWGIGGLIAGILISGFSKKPDVAKAEEKEKKEEDKKETEKDSD